MIICPKCKGRATKLYNINTGSYTCQQCGHKWTNEYAQSVRNDELRKQQHNNTRKNNNESTPHTRRS